MSDIIRKDFCDQCNRELGDPSMWHKDFLGNKFCSYRCKILYEEKE